ncbi:hypothetical protein R3P38DRAFT_2763725 [Favolaschia claudopus]|uniref:Uncharacterized protein n=1 Tax=Favolaschia claudopus TaxID=2862362 RepID=A0AAW0DCR4_9AGAR
MRTAYTLERRAVYDVVVSPISSWKKQVKKKGADRLEPAVDDLINAATRQTNTPCSRLPITIYFGNDTTDGGCPRCKVAASGVCCELCTPAKFIDFARVDIPNSKSQPKRSRIQDYSADDVDFALEAALHGFRKARTLELRGKAYLRGFGSSYVMPDDVLKRIVDCSHFFKIRTRDELSKETHWHRVLEDGEAVLALILQYRPTPPLPPIETPTPLRSLDQNTSAQAIPSTPSMRRCSKCRQIGHIFLKMRNSIESKLSKVRASLHAQTTSHATREYPPQAPTFWCRKGPPRSLFRVT